MMKSTLPISFNLKKTSLYGAFLSCMAFTFSSAAFAGVEDQARRIHDRLAGVPPTPEVLQEMVDTINNNGYAAAADIAMNNRNFYEVTVKNMAAPWTNEEQSSFVPLNDYSATVIGMIRDGVDFRELLFGDVLYIGKSGLGLNNPSYSMTSNAHYEELDDKAINLMEGLDKKTQSEIMSGIPPEATAGIMTTRAAAKAFFSAGTNRAMFRFTLLNHLCNDLEQVKDITLSPDRIRQDVSRSPGGDSRLFLNSCVGCHSGMDPMAQAYAYYNYDFDADAENGIDVGRLNYNQSGEIDDGVTNNGQVDPADLTRVQAKYIINAGNFAPGFITQDDSWSNYWREGQNSVLGWNDGPLNGSGSGIGAKSMGQELAYSNAFAQCQVKNVFQTVCLRQPTDSNDHGKINEMINIFKNGGHKMKPVFAAAAEHCMGD